jgi:glutathione S-transferase
MDTLLGNPAFRTYAICSSILAVKMILSAFYTSAMRFRTKGFVNEEDARATGDPNVKASPIEAPAVAHALRIQRNDGENILPFFAIGLLYVLTGASPFGASVYLWTFTIARLAHTIVYTAQLQPWRAITFFVGVLCMFGMATQIIRAAL